MSVIYSHTVDATGYSLFDKLKEEGKIHPDQLWGPYSKKMHDFDAVLDFNLLNEHARTYAQEILYDEQAAFEERLRESGQSAAEQTAALENYSKVDGMKMPVYRSESGGVRYMLNHRSDSTPVIAIGLDKPDEIFRYRLTQEGRSLGSMWTKGHNVVTPDGVPYAGTLCIVKDNMLRPVDKGNRFQVSVYVNQSDSKAARFYCDAKDVLPFDETLENDRRRRIVVRDMDAYVAMYRTLSDGSAVKDTLPARAWAQQISQAMSEYRSKVSQQRAQGYGNGPKSARPLPDAPQAPGQGEQQCEIE